ncbi:MAG: TonB-dependent receptor [Acidobacteria bacterium]|nr:TonB-dependent receptor [Acidobacteriota bacterium]
MHLTNALRQFAAPRQEYFVQADLQAAARLTLNLGLCYSYFGVYSETAEAIANLYAVDASSNIVADSSPFAAGRTAKVVAPATAVRPLYQPDRNNWQPRVGFAWDVTGQGATAVRVAYGTYDDRMMQLLF